MSSFIAILTCRSYRWKNPSLGPLVLLCSALIAVVTARVYSLWPKDLYGTIMPTCYIKMTEIIWNFGKKQTFSYKHVFSSSLTNVKWTFEINYSYSTKCDEEDCQQIAQNDISKSFYQNAVDMSVTLQIARIWDPTSTRYTLLVTCIILLGNVNFIIIDSVVSPLLDYITHAVFFIYIIICLSLCKMLSFSVLIRFRSYYYYLYWLSCRVDLYNYNKY